MPRKGIRRFADPRLLHGLLFASMALFLVFPAGFPVYINNYTRGLYDYIEKLPASSIVAVSIDFAAPAYDESGPVVEATVIHMFRKNLKLVFVGYNQDVPILSEKALSKLARYTSSKVYGEDYVVLPYVVGADTGLASFGRDPHGMFKMDYRGNDIDKLPLMNRVHHAKDFSLAIAYGAGQMDQAYVRQWYIPYGVKVGDCGSALFLNNIITDYESGLIVGGAVGVRGAAEYERLIGVLGDGTRNMDSINISHLMVVFAIAAANIRFLWQKTHQKKGG